MFSVLWPLLLCLPAPVLIFMIENDRQMMRVHGVFRLVVILSFIAGIAWTAMNVFGGHAS